MTARFTLFILAVLIAATACESLPPEKIIEVEVTRMIVVTATPEPATGPVPIQTETVSAQSVEATAVPNTATPAITPTPDVFPTPIVGQIFVAEQEFQDAKMFWLQPIKQIWILETDASGKNIWIVREDKWSEGLPENDSSLTPPADGLLQPIRGFGLLWRNDDALRSQVGWATSEEVGYTADYEYHWGGSVNANGEYVAGPGYHLLTTFNGEVYRFDEDTRTWSIVDQTGTATPDPNGNGG